METLFGEKDQSPHIITELNRFYEDGMNEGSAVGILVSSFQQGLSLPKAAKLLKGQDFPDSSFGWQNVKKTPTCIRYAPQIEQILTFLEKHKVPLDTRRRVLLVSNDQLRDSEIFVEYARGWEKNQPYNETSYILPIPKGGSSQTHYAFTVHKLFDFAVSQTVLARYGPRLVAEICQDRLLSEFEPPYIGIHIPQKDFLTMQKELLTQVFPQRRGWRKFLPF